MLRKIATTQSNTIRNFNWFKFPTPKPRIGVDRNAFDKHVNLCMTIDTQLPPTFSAPGIYKLKNNKNGMFYIGMSLNMKKRIKSHFMDAFRYRYDNMGKPNTDFSLVSQAIAEQDFDFNPEIVETMYPPKDLTIKQKKELLRQLEKEWIAKLESYKREIGYNVVR